MTTKQNMARRAITIRLALDDYETLARIARAEHRSMCSTLRHAALTWARAQEAQGGQGMGQVGG